ncbi:hypothetical protein ACWDSL_48545 [Streptomyces sp. NPDC000941]
MAGLLPQNSGNRSAQRFGPIVSRRLRTAGFNISPAAARHKRDGVFVRAAGNYISVLVDIPADASEVAEEIAAAVRTWGMEPEVTVSDGGAAWVRFFYRKA